MTQAAAFPTRERAVEASAAPRERAPEANAATGDRSAEAPATARNRVAPTPPATPQARAVEAPPKAQRGGFKRFLLIVVIPAVAAALALFWWLSTGRYVSTDNAFVGAEKTEVTPYVTGPIVAIDVKEGQAVKVGDTLFDIDPAPFETALALAEGRLAAAKVEFANLESQYASNVDQIKMGEDSVRLHQADFDRKHKLVETQAGTKADQDTSSMALVQAQQILEFVRSMQDTVKVKLGGGLDATIDTFPDYIQAKAAVDDAERNLGYTHITARLAGIATQVPQIEIGRVAPAGQPVFAIVANQGLWVDANPKESDLTYVTEGLPASVTIDAFPARNWGGTICSIAPGTGAQFAILPPQNASGNWVKVVQRVPLRFCFAPDEDTGGLRAGMSAIISIDTGRQRSLKSLVSDVLGAFAAPKKP